MSEDKLLQLDLKLDNIHLFLAKFDETVTHLQELVVSVDKVAALQEQRIAAYERQQEVIHQRIYSVREEYELKFEKLQDKRNLEHKEVMERVAVNERELAKWKWLVLGGFGVLSFIGAIASYIS
jgi:hypothetical protein